MKNYGRILMKHAIIVPINEVRAVVIYKLLNLAVPWWLIEIQPAVSLISRARQDTASCAFIIYYIS